MGNHASWREIRAAIRRATEGEVSTWTVDPDLELIGPRHFDAQVADDDIFGVYIIYAPTWLRGVDLGSSRIQYIGRGNVVRRLLDKADEKPGLWRLAHRKLLKFVAIAVSDEHGEFVFEGILLKEHVKMFGRLPRHNVSHGSSTLAKWRTVLRSSPGPLALLSRYGR